MKECKENHSTPKSIEASSIKKCCQSDSKHRTCLSKELNENEQDFQFHDQMGSRMLPPKKSIPKHFMSPTISATFKAIKRILIEKNEVSSPTLHTTTPTSENFRFHRFPLSPSSSRISESNFHDSGSKPYDPLTNFLSRRPTFRLYDPDKRVKVLHRLEKTSQMVDGETSSFSLSSSSTQETSLQEEDSARNAFDDDSDEELDEKKHDGILSKVMKVLLLLAVLMVSTVYISSMNSTSSTASSLLGKWGLIEEFPKSRTVFVVDTNDLMKGSVFLNQSLERIVRLMNVAESDLNEKFEEKDMSKQVLEKPREFSEKTNLAVERDSAGETFDLVQVSETKFVPNWMNYTDKILFDKLPVPLNEVLIENVITSEGTGKDEVVVEHDIPEPDLADTYNHVVDETIELRVSKLITPWEMDQLPTEKISSETSRVYKDIASEGTGKDEVVVEHDIPEPDLTYSYDHVVDETIELREPKLVTPWEVDQHSTENSRSETSGVYEDTESFSHKIDEKRIILGEILHTCEVDMNSGRRLSDQTRKTESIATEVVVVVGGIALVARLLMRCLAGLLRLIYLKFRKPSRKDSSGSIQSYVKSIVLEEDGGLPSDGKIKSTKEKEQFNGAEYHFNPPPCLQSEVDKFICGSAPTVKLLGEYVIPAEFSSSTLKTYSRRSSPEAQQRQWGISPCTPSAPQICPSTGLKSTRKSTPEEKIMRREACEDDGNFVVSKTILAVAVYNEGGGKTGVVGASDTMWSSFFPNKKAKVREKILAIRSKQIYALLAGSSVSATSVFNVMKKYAEDREESTVGQIARVGYSYMSAMQIFGCTLIIVGWEPEIGFVIYVLSGKLGMKRSVNGALAGSGAQHIKPGEVELFKDMNHKFARLQVLKAVSLSVERCKYCNVPIFGFRLFKEEEGGEVQCQTPIEVPSRYLQKVLGGKI